MKLTKNSKQDISPLWLLVIAVVLFITQFFVGNAGLTVLAGIMDILAIILFIAAVVDFVKSKTGPSLNRKQRSKLRKQQYAALTEKPIWRLVQALYGVLGVIWAIVLAARDDTNYTDNADRWSTVALWAVFIVIGYLVLRRLAVYIAHGKLRQETPKN